MHPNRYFALTFRDAEGGGVEVLGIGEHDHVGPWHGGGAGTGAGAGPVVTVGIEGRRRPKS